ncbi:MAG: hypothetical protein WCK77_12160 [Verrucomicrobiota bacterium]
MTPLMASLLASPSGWLATHAAATGAWLSQGSATALSCAAVMSLAVIFSRCLATCLRLSSEAAATASRIWVFEYLDLMGFLLGRLVLFG